MTTSPQAATTSTPLDEVSARRASQQRTIVGLATALGVVLSIVGISIGATMAFHRVPVTCPDGDLSPSENAPVHCYTYPHAGPGGSILVIAAMLGIVIGLACAITLMMITQTAAHHAASNAAHPSVDTPSED